jgi:hypothetical protein
MRHLEIMTVCHPLSFGNDDQTFAYVHMTVTKQDMDSRRVLRQLQGAGSAVRLLLHWEPSANRPTVGPDKVRHAPVP